MTNLRAFITHARSKGMDGQTLRILLLSAGWKEKQIAEALASEALDVPIPLPPDAGSAKEAFFHLLQFTTLYAMVVSLIVLCFQYIDLLLPDVALSPLSYASFASSIRWCMAIVLVAAPLFLLLSRSIVRSGIAEPEKLHSGVRRWLTYLTLFVTACAVIGDAIALLFSLLEGDLTGRFLLKVLVIFALTAFPFAYYFQTLRMSAQEYAQTMWHRVAAVACAVLVLSAVSWGLFIAGGPQYARKAQLDEARVEDLRMIQHQIFDMTYGPSRYNLQARPTQLPTPLPSNLLTVQEQATAQKIRITDPVSGMPYGYSVDGSTFSLCATFDLPRDEQYDVVWNHAAGEQCFQFDALDPMTFVR